MTIYLGATFKEPGFNAYDNCDDDITSKVEVSGSVDSAKIGIYTITYKVSDTAGNTATVKRVVNVISNNVSNK